MRADVRAELQMLRELVWFLLNPEESNWVVETQCCFCGFSLLKPGVTTFGHRRHPKVDSDITIHHVDENRENNAPSNLKLCHDHCHRSYHNQKRAAVRKEIISRVQRESDAKHPTEVC